MLLSVRKDSKILSRPNPCSTLTFPFHFYLFFFSKAPRKTAVKTEKPETSDGGEKKTSAERKTSAEESKDMKG